MIARLDHTQSSRLHVECVCDDGGSYCIETRHCVGDLQLPNNVVDVIVTSLDDGEKVPVSLIGGVIRMRQSVEFVVV